jgi:replicative DNA helicase Mcm
LFIPQEIACNKELVLAYLRGLFDTDGSVYDRKNHGNGRRGQIELTTIYRDFAKQIQNILFRLGIPAYLVEKKPKVSVRRDGSLIESKKQYHIYIIQNAAIDRFAELIGFSVKRKKEKLNEILGRKSVRQYMKRVPARIKKIRNVPSKHQYVYDITVEGSHSFIANGILVHNTAAAVRDEIGGGWTLEAGALVIGDGGIVSIDEADKMADEDRSAILESLEQQTVSVAKAGIVATLNTRTAVLAAANPKGGRFDRQRLISEQIDIPPVLLSRFDLIFIMRDEPHAERDRIVAHHMLELHRKPTDVMKPPLDFETLRKFIVYARKYIDPKLQNEEAMKTIEDFYVKWRSVAESGQAPVPITPRQLEAMIRLAKANARMRLSNQVTVEDANRAIKLISFYLQEAGLDTETGKVDIDVLMTGRSRSQREKIQRILDIIQGLEEDYGGAAPVGEIKTMAGSEGISEGFVDRVISEELRRGHLYEPKEGMVSRTIK